MWASDAGMSPERKAASTGTRNHRRIKLTMRIEMRLALYAVWVLGRLALVGVGLVLFIGHEGRARTAGWITLLSLFVLQVAWDARWLARRRSGSRTAKGA